MDKSKLLEFANDNSNVYFDTIFPKNNSQTCIKLIKKYANKYNTDNDIKKFVNGTNINNDFWKDLSVSHSGATGFYIDKQVFLNVVKNNLDGFNNDKYFISDNNLSQLITDITNRHKMFKTLSNIMSKDYFKSIDKEKQKFLKTIDINTIYQDSDEINSNEKHSLTAVLHYLASGIDNSQINEFKTEYPALTKFFDDFKEVETYPLISAYYVIYKCHYKKS